MIRFLLDEHVNPAIQRQLRRLNSQIDVLRVGEAEAPPKGMLDREILVWLEQRNYILVTENRNTMPAHFAAYLAAGQHVPGILCIRPDVTIGQIIDELYTIWYASSAEECRDRVQFIPL